MKRSIRFGVQFPGAETSMLHAIMRLPHILLTGKVRSDSLAGEQRSHFFSGASLRGEVHLL